MFWVAKEERLKYHTMSAHVFLSDCFSTSPALFFKSKSKVGFQPYLAEERQRSCYISRKDISISSKRGVCQEPEFTQDRHEYPNYRKRCSQCSYLIRHYRNWQSQGTWVGWLVCLCVCFSPLQLEMTLFEMWNFWSIVCFSVSCGAVLLQECRHSAITLAVADFLHVFVNFPLSTSKTRVLTMRYRLPHFPHVGRAGR